MIKTINFDNMSFTDEQIEEAMLIGENVSNIYSKFIKICSRANKLG